MTGYTQSFGARKHDVWLIKTDELRRSRVSVRNHCGASVGCNNSNHSLQKQTLSNPKYTKRHKNSVNYLAFQQP